MTHEWPSLFPGQTAADIGRNGGMQCIMAAMRNFTNSAELNSVGCRALWGLLINGRFVYEDEGWNVFIKQRHFGVHVIWFIIYSIIYSTDSEENSRIATEEGAIYDVVKSMRAHPDDVSLNESACTALLGLAMEGLYTTMYDSSWTNIVVVLVLKWVHCDLYLYT